MTYTVAVIVGSLRKASINRKLAEALQSLASDRLDFKYVAVGDLPFYNEDLWADPPVAVTRMKEQVEAADGVLIVSPEYNRFAPGMIFNAFDWGSRPYGKSCWKGKPVAICGATPGSTGTAAAQQHLRSAALNLSMIPMILPELYVTWSNDRFADDGTIKSDDTRKMLKSFVDSFADWIAAHGLGTG